jgi:hypothetical protein
VAAGGHGPPYWLLCLVSVSGPSLSPEFSDRLITVYLRERPRSLPLRGAMRYLLIFLLLLALWFLLEEFLLKDRRSEGLNSLTAKLKDLGTRVHWSIGVLAAAIVIIFVLRFLVRVIVSY